MRTVRLNIGTKRNNSVSDNSTAIALEDIDSKLTKLLSLFGKASLKDVSMIPVTSSWGREWTIVLTIEVTEKITRGKDIAGIACLLFEQEAVSFKEWDDVKIGVLVAPFHLASGLAYHIDYSGDKDDFDPRYFIGNDFEATALIAR